MKCFSYKLVSYFFRTGFHRRIDFTDQALQHLAGAHLHHLVGSVGQHALHGLGPAHRRRQLLDEVLPGERKNHLLEQTLLHRLLDEIGIPLVKHLPGVGQNLQDHLQVFFPVWPPLAGIPFGPDGTTDLDALKAAMAQVGAFSFSEGSADAALLASDLLPGAYTVQVAGVGDVTGVGLAEIYDLGSGADGPTELVNISNIPPVPFLSFGSYEKQLDANEARARAILDEIIRFWRERE